MTELTINLDFCYEVRLRTICYTLRLAQEFHLRVNGKIYTGCPRPRSRAPSVDFINRKLWEH